MMDEGAIQPTVPAVEPKPKRIYETDGRDRVLLAFALGLGVFVADLLLFLPKGAPGLGLGLLVLAWEGVMLWYAGGVGKLKKAEDLFLTVAVLFLAADVALFSNSWFWTWNMLAIPALMMVQMFGMFGEGSFPWYRPIMLVERFLLLMEGLFGFLPAPFHALCGGKKPQKRFWYVAGGAVTAFFLLVIVAPMLAMADQVFNKVVGDMLYSAADHLGSLLGRVLLGLVFCPFLFGLFYSLRRPGKCSLTEADLPHGVFASDPALSLTVLAVLDALYVFFAGVQFRALFGGAAYIEAMGISYADYARSGFFQLVGVSCINLLVVVAAVQFSKREGKLWQGVRILATLMVILTAGLLVSAASRMTLYVTTYGLSFKRMLTYWGMVMLAIFFAAAVLKIWKGQFAFFKVLFAAGIAGWLVLNAVNVDAVVSHYNVELYLTGNTAVMDLPYLGYLSYDALKPLTRLDGSMKVYYDAPREDLTEYTLDMLLHDRRQRAFAEASNWRTWTLSAYLAASE